MHKNSELHWVWVFFWAYNEIGETNVQAADFSHSLLPHLLHSSFQQGRQHNCRKATRFPTALGKIGGECFRTREIPSRADLRVSIRQIISSGELKVPKSSMLQVVSPSSHPYL